MDRAGATPKSAAGRTACINIRALPLRLLLRSHPQWRERPVAVVEEDKPLSPILWLNAVAVKGGIRPGMKYAAALSLDRGLCAGTVSEEEVGAAVRQVHGALDRFSPRVEPSAEEPGIFWVDAGGLDRLYASLEDWAGQMHAALSGLELPASIAVGFGRFGTYAVAKARDAVAVLPTMAAEDAESRKVRLLDLQLEPKLRERLDKLAVYTVGDFLALPGERIARHLGEQARALYRFAAGDRSLPLQPRGLSEPLRARMELDANESDARGPPVPGVPAIGAPAEGRGRKIPGGRRPPAGVPAGERHAPPLPGPGGRTDAGRPGPAGAGGPAPGNDFLPLPPGGAGPRGGGRARHRRQAEPPAGESGPRHRPRPCGPWRGSGPSSAPARSSRRGWRRGISRKPVSGGSLSASSPRPPPGPSPCAPWCAAPTPVPGSWKASP